MDKPLNPAILYVLIFVCYCVCVCVCACLRQYLQIWLRNILVSNYFYGTDISGSCLPEHRMTNLLMRTVNFLLTHIAGRFTSEDVRIIVGCTTHLKIHDTGRRTATWAKEGIDLTRVNHLTSRRGIAAIYAGFSTVNLYAPYGTSQRQARGTYIMSTCYISSVRLIMGGDFNCVLSPKD